MGPQIRIRIDVSFHSSSKLVFSGRRTGSGGLTLWFPFLYYYYYYYYYYYLAISWAALAAHGGFQARG